MSGGGSTIDWASLRRRLARQGEAFERAAAGRGPWAEALLDQRAAHLAGPAAAADPDMDGERVTLLVGRGASGRYAMEIAECGRTLPVTRVTPVPGGHAALLGLIAVGGRVVRLFDTDRLCGAPADPSVPAASGHAVTLRGDGGGPLALRFHAVEAVAGYDAGALVTGGEASTAMERAGAGGTVPAFIRALTGDRIAVLDVAAIRRELGRTPGQ